MQDSHYQRNTYYRFTSDLPLKLAQLCFSAPPPLPQFHLFHLSKRFSCDRVIGGFVRNLTVAAASLCPTLIEIRGDPIREASAGWKKVEIDVKPSQVNFKVSLSSPTCGYETHCSLQIEVMVSMMGASQSELRSTGSTGEFRGQCS